MTRLSVYSFLVVLFVTSCAVIEKFRVKLSGWKCNSLSFAGKIVLINSVLSALPLYYLSIFEVPKQVLLRIDRIRRNFLWGNWSGDKKLIRVNWGKICTPKSKGGAGVVNIKAKNKALLAKWGWRFITEKNALWRKVISTKYGESKPSWILSNSMSRKASTVWKGIVRNLYDEKVSKWLCPKDVRWKLGNGESILFWEDCWCGDSSFRDAFPRLYRLSTMKGVTVASIAGSGKLSEVNLQTLFSRPLLDREMQSLSFIKDRLLDQSLNSKIQDKVLWVHDQAGLFSVSKLTDLLINAELAEPDFNFDLLWKIKVPPKVKNFLWMLKIKRIPTKEFLMQKGVKRVEADFGCSWCEEEVESASHLFVACSYTRNFWRFFCEWWSIRWSDISTIDELFLFCFSSTWTGITKSVWFITIASALWSLWLARNDKVFRGKTSSSKDIMFYTKMRALIWIKAVNAELLLHDEDWWSNPCNCLAPMLNKDYEDWIPPNSGYVKFNVDGSFYNNAAGCGGVLRSNEGNVRALFSGPVENIGSDFAELMAIRTALLVFIDAGWVGQAKLIIESDSRVVLNWIANALIRLWRWWKHLKKLIDW